MSRGVLLQDAFEGLATIDAYLDPLRRSELLEQLHADAGRELGRRSALNTSPRTGAAPRSSLRR